MWRAESMLAALAYQTHGEGWRLGAGADVDLHIQRQASGGCVLRCVCVCVHALEKSNGLHECGRGKGWGREWMEWGWNLCCCQQCHMVIYGQLTLSKIKLNTLFTVLNQEWNKSFLGRIFFHLKNPILLNGICFKGEILWLTDLFCRLFGERSWSKPRKLSDSIDVVN